MGYEFLLRSATPHVTTSESVKAVGDGGTRGMGAGTTYLQHEDRRAVQLLGDAAVVLVDGEHGRLVVLVDHAHLHRGGVLPLAVRRHHVQLVPAQAAPRRGGEGGGRGSITAFHTQWR